MLNISLKKKKKYIFGIPSKYIYSCYYFVHVLYILILTMLHKTSRKVSDIIAIIIFFHEYRCEQEFYTTF